MTAIPPLKINSIPTIPLQQTPPSPWTLKPPCRAPRRVPWSTNHPKKRLLGAHSSNSTTLSSFASPQSSFVLGPLLFPDAVPPHASLNFAYTLAELHPKLALKVLPATIQQQLAGLNAQSLDAKLMVTFRLFFELCAQLDYLRKYVITNYIVLVKILRKYDAFTSKDSAQFLPQLSSEPFYTSAKLAIHLKRAERIMDRFVGKNSAENCGENSNNSAENKLNGKCGLCGRTLKNPVSLKCSHSFCFVCLGGDSSFGLNCPICRIQTELDPNDLAIDSVLNMFLGVKITNEAQNSNNNSGNSGNNANFSENMSGAMSYFPVDSRVPTGENSVFGVNPQFLQSAADIGEYFESSSGSSSDFDAESGIMEQELQPTNEIAATFQRKPRIRSNFEVQNSGEMGAEEEKSTAGSIRRDKASCHQCKTTKDAGELLFCTHKNAPGYSKTRMEAAPGEDPQPRPKKQPLKHRNCRKKYCFTCLKRSYGVNEPNEQEKAQWTCFACRDSCICAQCQRARHFKQNEALMLGATANQPGKSPGSLNLGAIRDELPEKLRPKHRKPSDSQMAARAKAPQTVSGINSRYNPPFAFENPGSFFFVPNSPSSQGSGGISDNSPLLTPHNLSRPDSPLSPLTPRSLSPAQNLPQNPMINAANFIPPLPRPRSVNSGGRLGSNSAVQPRPRLKVSSPLQANAVNADDSDADSEPESSGPHSTFSTTSSISAPSSKNSSRRGSRPQSGVRGFSATSGTSGSSQHNSPMLHHSPIMASMNPNPLQNNNSQQVSALLMQQAQQLQLAQMLAASNQQASASHSNSATNLALVFQSLNLNSLQQQVVLSQLQYLNVPLNAVNVEQLHMIVVHILHQVTNNLINNNSGNNGQNGIDSTSAAISAAAQLRQMQDQVAHKRQELEGLSNKLKAQELELIQMNQLQHNSSLNEHMQQLEYEAIKVQALQQQQLKQLQLVQAQQTLLQLQQQQAQQQEQRNILYNTFLHNAAATPSMGIMINNMQNNSNNPNSDVTNAGLTNAQRLVNDNSDAQHAMLALSKQLNPVQMQSLFDQVQQTNQAVPSDGPPSSSSSSNVKNVRRQLARKESFLEDTNFANNSDTAALLLHQTALNSLINNSNHSSSSNIGMNNNTFSSSGLAEMNMSEDVSFLPDTSSNNFANIFRNEYASEAMNNFNPAEINEMNFRQGDSFNSSVIDASHSSSNNNANLKSLDDYFNHDQLH
jgi:hypothetical protein